MSKLRNIGIGTLAVAATALPALPATAAAPTASSAALRQFEGTVVSVNRDARTFRLRDAQAGTKRIKVTSSTRFQRIAGFSALKPGMKRVEATVKRSNGRWVATKVERSGGGGSHGGGGADDGPNHT
jgi:uncharacterized membrane protein YgcG